MLSIITISWADIPDMIDVLLTSDSLFVRNKSKLFSFLVG